MKKMNNSRLRTSIMFLLIILGTQIFAQEKKTIFLGFQPGVTVEPFYPEGEFDVNVLPVVFLTPLSKRIDFRATSILNYHLGGNEQVSDVGVQTVWPIYFASKEEVRDRSKGFYIGPVMGFGYNLMSEHITVTTAFEPGYIFESEKNFTLSIGIQFGVSYFKYDDGSDKWQNHWGPKINLGWWL